MQVIVYKYFMVKDVNFGIFQLHHLSKLICCNRVLNIHKILLGFVRNFA